MTRLNFPDPASSPYTENGITYVWNDNGGAPAIGFWEATGDAINLQTVTDAGNTTTNGATFADGQFVIQGNNGTVLSRRDGGTAFAQLGSQGLILSRGAAAAAIFNGVNDATGTTTTSILGNGSATFASGQFEIDTNGAVEIQRAGETARAVHIDGRGSVNIARSFRDRALQISDTDNSNSASFYVRGDGYTILASANPGICFGPSEQPADTLDDYEEGTWTPVVGSGGATFTASEQLGRYVKVGGQVTASCRITTQMGTITGANAVCTMQLPFNIAGNSSGVAAIKVFGGGPSFGAMQGHALDHQIYASDKQGATANTSPIIQIGTANTDFYPASTDVTLEFDLTYPTTE